MSGRHKISPTGYDAHKISPTSHEVFQNVSTIFMGKIYDRMPRKPPLSPDDNKVLSKLKKVKKHFHEFCNNSSTPGLAYLSEPNRPVHERVLWLVGIGLSLFACAYLIRETWGRWIASPIIIAMDENLRAVWEIPFPAITVCPRALIDHNTFNFSDVFERYLDSNITESENETFQYISIQCDLPIVGEEIPDDDRAIRAIEENSLSLDERFKNLQFKSSQYPPEIWFQPIMTSSGLCHTMNMLPKEMIFRNNTFYADKNYLDYNINGTVYWTIDSGYSASASTDVYPVRALAAGIDGGLYLVLGTKFVNDENYCSLSVGGFQIVLHSPADFPLVQEQSLMVPFDSTVHVGVSPLEVITSERLRTNYSPEQRKCYFPYERYLRFFKIYTRTNCEVECLANITLAHCGCVAFHMPRMHDTRICGTILKNCLTEAKDLFQLVVSGIAVEGEELEAKEKIKAKVEPCDCKQSCSSIAYSTTRSQVPTDVIRYMTHFHRFFDYEYEEEFSSSHWILLRIYYEETHFIPKRRMELFGVTTFIANIGGVLGLCLGMSVLSAIELIYWLIIRPFWKSKKTDKETHSKESYPITFSP